MEEGDIELLDVHQKYFNAERVKKKGSYFYRAGVIYHPVSTKLKKNELRITNGLLCFSAMMDSKICFFGLAFIIKKLILNAQSSRRSDKNVNVQISACIFE